jgi:hypothetical protein
MYDTVRLPRNGCFGFAGMTGYNPSWDTSGPQVFHVHDVASQGAWDLAPDAQNGQGATPTHVVPKAGLQNQDGASQNPDPVLYKQLASSPTNLPTKPPGLTLPGSSVPAADTPGQGVPTTPDSPGSGRGGRLGAAQLARSPPGTTRAMRTRSASRQPDVDAQPPLGDKLWLQDQVDVP